MYTCIDKTMQIVLERGSIDGMPNCERSEPVTRVGWRISLVYIIIYIYIFVSMGTFGPAWAPVTRNAQTSDRPVEVQWSI